MWPCVKCVLYNSGSHSLLNSHTNKMHRRTYLVIIYTSTWPCHGSVVDSKLYSGCVWIHSWLNNKRICFGSFSRDVLNLILCFLVQTNTAPVDRQRTQSRYMNATFYKVHFYTTYTQHPFALFTLHYIVCGVLQSYIVLVFIGLLGWVAWLSGVLYILYKVSNLLKPSHKHPNIHVLT